MCMYLGFEALQRQSGQKEKRGWGGGEEIRKVNDTVGDVQRSDGGEDRRKHPNGETSPKGLGCIVIERSGELLTQQL